MTVNNFITQARIDDEKFTQVVQHYRNFRTEMNLQYCKLRRKTFSSIYSLPKNSNHSISHSPPPARTSIHRPYKLNKIHFEESDNKQQKDQNIFVVTTVHVKARRPESTEAKLSSVQKKPNPIRTPKVRSIQSRNEVYRK